MREGVPQQTTAGVDEFSPTVAPTSSPAASNVTEAATGVPRRQDEDPTDTLLGATLVDRYRIERRIGAGGMGAVYVGTHLALARKIAVKVIQPRLGADPTIAQRFIQEARAASAIGHEHIVHITDFGTTAEGGSFLVMEYLDGEDLSETLRRDGPLPWQRVIHLGEQIAWALAAAHKHGIVHRDIKPANCYRVPREQDPDFIKVLDFGLAKFTEVGKQSGESLTNTGMLLGTPGYIAPELYRGLKADHRVDIYALGALMHKLLTGELPPMCGSDDGEPMRGLPAPDAVATVLGKALRENPDQRWATAGDLAQALRAIPRATSDEPTQLQGISGPNAAKTHHDRRPDTPSVATLTSREPTPTSFSSLVTVERDGSRVRLSLGIPAVIVLIALIGGLVYMVTRHTEPIDDIVDASIADYQNRIPPPPVAATPPQPGPPLAPLDTPPPPTIPPPVANPPPTTPVANPPTTPIANPPTTPVANPPTPANPPTTPVADPPPPATPPATKPDTRVRGSTKALERRFRGCLEGFGLASFYEVALTWKTDPDGRIKPDTIKFEAKQPQPLPTALKECVLDSLGSSDYAWKPDHTYKSPPLIEIGTRPTPAG